jgi:hypothetical protein
MTVDEITHAGEERINERAARALRRRGERDRTDRNMRDRKIQEKIPSVA